eukprot:snap_masked-scaffold566_size135349-processed-gene-0.0 protein:Tk08886 transcript:snap_masked-scaffold566_size135349-processed-gene-0.0-mRNA-1 annotation:"hypothetical protein DAPPUDRAFT_308941"
MAGLEGLNRPLLDEARARNAHSARGAERVTDRTPMASPAAVSGEPQHERYATLGLGLAGLMVEHLMSHPWVVLRRQCQVHTSSVRSHHTPFSLVPVMATLTRWQGVGALWKGLGSTLTVRGLTLAVEDCTSKFTPWPKEVDRRSSLRSIGQHLLLKAVSLAVLTPFYSASLVETVQSEIASERPGMLDVFREGLARLFNCASAHSGRMLPMWILMPATVVHGVSHYILMMTAKGLTLAALQRRHRQTQRCSGAIMKENSAPTLTTHYHEQLAMLVGHLVADITLFPAETILHRLHLQGCRTIIDNLDSGREVTPILTRYEGFWDCLAISTYEEGYGSLFKGLGALILQYGIHFALIRLGASVVDKVLELLNQDGPELDPTRLATPIRSSTRLKPRNLTPILDDDLGGLVPASRPAPGASPATLDYPRGGRSPVTSPIRLGADETDLASWH